VGAFFLPNNALMFNRGLKAGISAREYGKSKYT